MSVRRVLAVTGIRSEYDMMASVYEAIDAHRSLQLAVAVTGAHLSEAYGYTINQIRADGFTIAEQIESLISGDRAGSRLKGLAVQLQGLVQTVERVQPDVLLVLGDREEAMTTALVGAYLNVIVAHVGGGDRVVGNVDDQVRHAVSRLAHIHCVTNSESYDRLIRAGEQPFRVHNVGSPGLDRLVSTPPLSAADISRLLGFQLEEGEPFVVVIQHPLSSEIVDAYDQMRTTLEAVQKIGVKTVLSYPNSDAGGQQMIRAIREFEGLPFLYTAKSIPRLEFVNLIRRASCLVGNSSAGIIEAPLLKLPAVNVGNRQRGRLHADNVEFVPHDRQRIEEALRQAIFDPTYRLRVANCTNPYGDGRTAERIASLLATIPLDSSVLIKDMTY